jgi:hypothetical protein
MIPHRDAPDSPPAAPPAPARAGAMQDLQAGREWPAASVCTLPGGYAADDGVVHREVELSPLTGFEEEFLAGVGADVTSAGVVTWLLGRCLRRVGSLGRVDLALVRDLLVGDRDYLLVKVREISFGAALDIVVRCPDAQCGKPMDIKLLLNEIEFEHRPVAARFFKTQLSPAAAADGEPRPVEFRLPTGGDIEALAHITLQDEEEAVNQLLARCVRRAAGEEAGTQTADGLSVAARREIEAEMSRLAPRAEIEIAGACPDCQQPFSMPLDFMACFAAEARQNLRTLEASIHFLAWHYHWSERDILSLTPRKRLRYVKLLNEKLEHT